MLDSLPTPEPHFPSITTVKYTWGLPVDLKLSTEVVHVHPKLSPRMLHALQKPRSLLEKHLTRYVS